MSRFVLATGDQAPEFSGTDQHGRVVALTSLLERGPVVLYFYPRDFTPVCTRQACFFRDAFEELDGHGAAIVGVSTDEVATHGRFSQRLGLPFSLLADPDGALTDAYGVRARLWGATKRVTYVIDRDRTIVGVFHYELRAQKHVEEVRACLASLASRGSLRSK